VARDTALYRLSCYSSDEGHALCYVDSNSCRCPGPLLKLVYTRAVHRRDQPENAQRIEEIGCGSYLKKDHWKDPSELIMTINKYRQRSLQVQQVCALRGWAQRQAARLFASSPVFFSPYHPSLRTSTPPLTSKRPIPCPTQQTHAIGLLVAQQHGGPFSAKDPLKEIRHFWPRRG
jgi:hypothetical protein